MTTAAENTVLQRAYLYRETEKKLQGSETKAQRRTNERAHKKAKEILSSAVDEALKEAAISAASKSKQ